jgi:hypothetical protein
VTEPALSDSRTGVSSAEFWNAADTATATRGGVAAGVAHSTQVPTSGIEESDIMSRHCSTLRHFGTSSAIKENSCSL